MAQVRHTHYITHTTARGYFEVFAVGSALKDLWLHYVAGYLHAQGKSRDEVMPLEQLGALWGTFIDVEV